MKPEIESRVDESNNKLTERLDDGYFQVNSYVDDKFGFILLDKDLIKHLCVNYAIGFMPTNEEYDNMIIEGQPSGKDEVIYKYLNMNSIFDVGTNDERRGTVVKRSWGLDGRVIGRLHTNP